MCWCLHLYPSWLWCQWVVVWQQPDVRRRRLLWRAGAGELTRTWYDHWTFWTLFASILKYISIQKKCVRYQNLPLFLAAPFHFSKVKQRGGIKNHLSVWSFGRNEKHREVKLFKEAVYLLLYRVLLILAFWEVHVHFSRRDTAGHSVYNVDCGRCVGLVPVEPCWCVSLFLQTQFLVRKLSTLPSI